MQRPGTGTHSLHNGKEEDAAPTTYRAYEGGWDIYGPTEGSAKTSRKGQTQKCVDIGGDMEARRRESLRAKGDGSTHEDSETGQRHTGKPSGG